MTAVSNPALSNSGLALAERLFDELLAHTSDDPGVTRAAFGEGEDYAHRLMTEVGRELGLDIETDGVGNLYLTYAGQEPGLPGWIVGSHLDSVPHGGNFDGAAGVIAGLSVVSLLKRRGVRPRRPITVMAIRAEESTWFPVSYLGSRAALGRLPADALETVRADTGKTLAAHMAAHGWRPEDIASGRAHLRPEQVHGFIEVHIEQGPVLEAEALPVGLVTAIAGSFRYRNARCLGEWGHSGAVPRGHRVDAVFGLSELIVALDAFWARLEAEGQEATITVGQVATPPELHAFSKVPGEVAFCLDVRSRSADVLMRIEEKLGRVSADISRRRGVRFDWGERTGSQPAELDAALLRGLAEAATAAAIPFREMPSGAGHDTAAFSAAGIASALIFVRNQNGSHNPDEAMRLEDFGAAVDVLVRYFTDNASS